MFRADLRLELGRYADTVQKAVELENEDYLRSRVDEGNIEAVCTSDDLMSLLRTLDDFIACVQVAVRTAGLHSPP